MWYLGPGFVCAGQPILDFLIHQCNISSRVTMCLEWKSALFLAKKLPTVENSHEESTQGLEKVPKMAPNRQISSPSRAGWHLSSPEIYSEEEKIPLSTAVYKNVEDGMDQRWNDSILRLEIAMIRLLIRQTTTLQRRKTFGPFSFTIIFIFSSKTRQLIRTDAVTSQRFLISLLLSI